MSTDYSIRGPAAAAAAGGIGLGLALTLLVPGLTPWSPAAIDPVPCIVYYDALDPLNPALSNPAKEPGTPLAMGTPVIARDEAGIKAELDARREAGADNKCELELLATHYADWSNPTDAVGRPLLNESGQPIRLTSRVVAYADIDSFVDEMIAHRDVYETTLAEVKKLESESSFGIEENIPVGRWSLYAEPDGLGGVITKIGTTGHVGTAAVFTHPSGLVIKYRLECGFQILHEFPPPGLPECEANHCNPPPCPSDKPYGTFPVCKDTPAQMPGAEEAPTGYGLNNDPGDGGVRPVTQPTDVARTNPPAPTSSPTPTSDPIVAPTAEPSAAPTNDPAVGCAPAPGKICP